MCSKTLEFTNFLSKSMLDNVQTAIEESGFPEKDSSGMGKMVLQSSPIASPKIFTKYHE
jgi:hypothetical protein